MAEAETVLVLAVVAVVNVVVPVVVVDVAAAEELLVVGFLPLKKRP